MVLCELRDARYYESAQASVAPPFWEGLGVGVGAPNTVTLGPFLWPEGRALARFKGVHSARMFGCRDAAQAAEVTRSV